MEQFYLVNRHINNVFLLRIKEIILWPLQSKKKKVFKKQTTQVKGKKRMVYLMSKKIKIKHLHHLKIRKTTLVILMRRRVVPMNIQVQLVVV